MNRKCFSSITSSFASIYLISAFFAVSFFSLLYIKYPPTYINHFDYLHIIKLNNPTPETPTTSLTDDDFTTPSVNVLKESNVIPTASPPTTPSPSPSSSPTPPSSASPSSSPSLISELPPPGNPTPVEQEHNLTTVVESPSEDSVVQDGKAGKDDEESSSPSPVSETEQMNDNDGSNQDDLAAKADSDSKIAPETAPVMEKTEKVAEEEEEEDEAAIAAVDHLSYPPDNSTKEERMQWIKQKLPESRILESTPSTRKFEQKVQKFVESTNCKATIYMTWISTTRFFGKREMVSLESVVKAHPDGCVIIVSRLMASKQGRKMLEPFIKGGHKVLPVAPDFSLLFEGTPAQNWLQRLKDGQLDPGKIPITQNLSNLLRIVILYKYGGVYLDTDMIMLKDVSNLRNTIGIQEVDEKRTTWNSVNNAVLIFDKGHPLLLRFMEEFSATFDGNVWGYNGPYMATRIIKKIVYDSHYQFNIMSPLTFYPVDWFSIHRFFWNPKANNDSKWALDMEMKVRGQSYGVHLWNKVSSPLKIEKGSIIGRLMSDYCIICQDVYGS